MIRRSTKETLHPRNRFRDGYDFPALLARSPALAPFVAENAHGDLGIDWADPAAVKALNQALLRDAYGIAWDVPAGYLCPPVPGRSDYVHYLADLLGARAAQATVLDIGTGANCVYPLLGASEYGWRFVATEVDPVAARWAQGLVAQNPAVAALIEVRAQAARTECFAGVVRPGETFAASMCNPPFHASARAVATSNLRKRRNLAGGRTPPKAPRNFGGTSSELWCPGGERGFLLRMIAQSAARPGLCRWFTTLVAKGDHLPALQHALREAGARDVRTIAMAQGQKQSRILAWTFAP